MKKSFTYSLCFMLSVLCFASAAHALSLSSLFGGDSKTASGAASAAAMLWDAAAPEDIAKKLIDKCAVPTTDGICECVANAVLANLTQEQWKTVNHYIFDTRATISTTDFLLANPWIVPKLATPYLKCSGKN